MRWGAIFRVKQIFETLLELAHEHQIHVRDDMGAGAILEELYGTGRGKDRVPHVLYGFSGGDLSPGGCASHQAAPWWNAGIW